MGTRGLRAYLYKNRYYRSRIPCDAYPDGFGDWFAAQIPREQEARQAWIQSLGERLEEEVAWRREHDIKDDDELEDAELNWGEDCELTISYLGRALLFQDFQSNTQGVVPDGDYDVEWSYVIDLNNRAFTINGLMHFRLDNMPPGSLNSRFWRIPSPIYPGSSCIPTFAHPPSTPIEHIATVSRWPPPDFDVLQAHEDYTKLAPIVLSADDWGAPTWASLTVAQHLSANLVQTVLLDSAEKLSNPDLVEARLSFGVCCWQLMCAATPSLLCHPVEPPPRELIQNRSILPLAELETSRYQSCMTPHDSELGGRRKLESYDHKYHWFRGCLVVFCHRLDTIEYVEHETVQMAQSLRNRGSSTGIGIIFSGRHILAVAVDGGSTRCSHPLRFHDAKMRCQDGFLLTTHLLCPHLAANKAPWSSNPAQKPIVAIGGLPEELVLRIAFQLDHDSYHNLARVSRLFRKIYVQHPRVGNLILCGYVHDGNYRVLQTTTGAKHTLHLQRSAPFYTHHKDLVRSFQYISFEPYDLCRDSGFHCTIHGTESVRGDGVGHEDDCSQIRLQVVHGIWYFDPPAQATSNFPKAVGYIPERDRRPGRGTWDQFRW